MDAAALTLSGGAAAVVAFLVMAFAEAARPWRPMTELTRSRWIGNVALWVLAIGLNVLITPALSQVTTWVGVVRPAASAPLWLQIALGLPALDVLTYALHRVLHASEFL